MDKQQLKQLKYLKSEIEAIKKEIESLDYVTVTDKVKGSSSHYPYVARNFTIEGIDYEGYENKVKRLQGKLQRRIDELIDMVEETNDYISNIDDSLVRQIISLRYVNGLTWAQVAASIGGNNTADSVRKVAERFLKE
ncbi:RNA polymerase subunit sigma-24 [Clostridium sp.]|jgi:hypothetical protein|uniref:RNA polymerase subunit sigma-24 n=1 Tax=Clostridium sp. TaxID=1506 RepID=UPI003A11F8B5